MGDRLLRGIGAVGLKRLRSHPSEGMFNSAISGLRYLLFAADPVYGCFGVHLILLCSLKMAIFIEEQWQLPLTPQWPSYSLDLLSNIAKSTLRSSLLITKFLRCVFFNFIR